MFMWRFSMVGPRILAFALLASVTRVYVVLSIIMGHWIVSIIYAVCKRFPSENNPVAEMVLCIVTGFMFIFTDWNTTNGYKRPPYLVYYVIIFVENVTMVIVWFILTPDKRGWYHFAALVVVTGGFGIGLIFMIFYYLNFQVLHIKCCCSRARDRRPDLQYTAANPKVSEFVQ